MKNIVILYAGSKMNYAFDKIFNEKSAFERALLWAKNSGEKIIVFTCSENHNYIEEIRSKLTEENFLNSNNFEIIEKNQWTNLDLSKTISESCKKNNADFALFAWADLPFLNQKLTDELVKMHVDYMAEYTFADGFPYGITPEVIDGGCANILASLSESVQKNVGEKLASRDGLFAIMKGDINSFEIETLVAEKDYRLLRFEFECSSKINFVACKNLFEKIGGDEAKIGEPYELCDIAESSLEIQKTIPAFYNIQISSKYNHKSIYNPIYKIEKYSEMLKSAGDMDFESFKALVKKINDFSQKAVVSLSCWGEPLLNPKFLDFAKEVLNYENLTLLVETDGICLTEEIAKNLADFNGRIDWIILLDSMDKNQYSQIHNCSTEDFDKAVASVMILEKYFPHHVYPQMTRMKMNENNLESFFRFWKEPSSPSQGELIIQKYDKFCAELSDEKSADLSPLVRNACWHLRRDFVVLADGSVPLCRDLSFGEILGNAFKEELPLVWAKIDSFLQEHLNKNYSEKCRMCDEYYTFNF
ncbi:spiro-SPASM protein [Treponema zioleckii]|uniref:spiro-SPASM protein n=1 Tax=Treponema zioleckii TaxID=331680 RepID=UPI00168B93B2|nr:spiro-SPASM protein [Treponema zioleckii]